MSYPINLHPTNFQWGFFGNTVSGTSTNLAIVANKWYSCNFVCQEDYIPDEVTIPVDAATGVSLSVEIWETSADTACKPSNKVANSGTPAAQTPTGAEPVVFSGLQGTSNGSYFGKTLTVVVKAGSGTPSGNIFNGPTAMVTGSSPSNIKNGGYSSSTDLGTSWSTLSSGYQFAQVRWPSGNINWPMVASITSYTTSDQIYGSIFVDLVFRSPPAWISVNGIMQGAVRRSTSSSMPDLDVSLLVNGSITATQTIAAATLPSTWSAGPGGLALGTIFLPHPVIIPPNAEVRIRINANQSSGSPTGGSSSYCYALAKLNLADELKQGLIPGMTKYALNGVVDYGIIAQGALIFNLTEPFPEPPINRRNTVRY